MTTTLTGPTTALTVEPFRAQAHGCLGYLVVDEPSRSALAVDRQVQLIVGSMVLTSVALGLLVSPWFLAIAAFVGAGLTFAGATGTCGLAFLLMKMPWNRPLTPPVDGPGAVCAAGGGISATCAAGGDGHATCAPAPSQRN